jgi:hypothetical protein
MQRVQQPVVGLGLDLELVPPGLLAVGLGVVAADPQRQRDLVPRARRLEVGPVEDVSELVGRRHQYFRSIGM